VAGITIERLLNHTSGLADKIEGAGTSSTVAQRVVEYLDQPVLFKAGSKWNYNNVNYLVLGYIIEKLTGQSYKDHMTNHLFKPAGMQHTYVCEEDALIMKRTAGYMMNGRGVRNDKIPDMRIMYAAGGIMSTAADMLAWNNALHAGKLLKKETLVRAFAPARLSNGTSAPYGYGWHIENIQGSLAYRHGGSLQGFVSEMAYLPGEDVFVVLLLNMQSKKHVVALHRIITAMTTGKRYALTETSIDSTSLPKFKGVYTNQLNEKIIITLNGRSLQFQRPGGRLLTLKAASPTDFFIDEGFVQVQFHLDSTQQVTSLTLSRVGLQAVDWKKTE
jgi:CubicO group peptidase (beta-lactamase class C family)